MEWGDVLYISDLDLATETFTRKLRYMLNIHAPWVIFQKRKFFIPWITKETKQLMMERERFKEEAKTLAVRDKGRGVSEEQRLASENYKRLRNKVTKNKRQDKIKYKSKKINEALESPDGLECS